jgi:hypothetical protein
MSWVYVGLTVEKVIVFGCPFEQSVVWVHHAFCKERKPLSSHPIPVATLVLSTFTHKCYAKLREPKVIRLILEILKC